jgi:hypothetical protein
MSNPSNDKVATGMLLNALREAAKKKDQQIEALQNELAVSDYLKNKEHQHQQQANDIKNEQEYDIDEMSNDDSGFPCYNCGHTLECHNADICYVCETCYYGYDWTHSGKDDCILVGDNETRHEEHENIDCFTKCEQCGKIEEDNDDTEKTCSCSSRNITLHRRCFYDEFRYGQEG